MGKKSQSAIVKSMEYCYECGKPYPEVHHIFFGSRRKLSDKYGYVLPLCYEHHRGDRSPHKDRNQDLIYKRIAQMHFEENHGTRNDFIRVFGKSYL